MSGRRSSNLDNDKRSQPQTSPVTSLSSVEASRGNLVFATCLDGNVSLLDGDSMQSLFTTHAGTNVYSGALAKTSVATDGPVSMFYAGEDGNVMQCVVGGSERGTVIGVHSGPISCIKYSSQWGVVTGSWDSTIRTWDTRSSSASRTINLVGSCEAMDVQGNRAVVMTNNGYISVWDFVAGKMEYNYESPLNYKAQSCSFFHDGKGFCISSIEGRVCVEYFEHLSNRSSKENFMFRCHRESENEHVYAVNAVQFHPSNSLFTIGSDGTICFWDKDNRTRLKLYENYKNSCIGTAGCYSSDGRQFYYSLTPNLNYNQSTNHLHGGPYLFGDTLVFGHTMLQEEVKKGYTFPAKTL